MDFIDKAFSFGYVYALAICAAAIVIAHLLSLEWWSPLIVIGSAAATQLVVNLWPSK